MTAIQDTPSGIISGDNARALIQRMLDEHEGAVRTALAGYNRSTAIDAWLETLRCIDEFLNIFWFGGASGPDKEWLESCALDERIILDMSRMQRMMEIVERSHDRGVAQRFRRMVVLLAEANRVLKERGLRPTGLPNGIDTIGTGRAYLQSRRRHFVSLLYAMPSRCVGEKPLEVLLAFPTIACWVEHSCNTITGLHQKLLLLEVYPSDFTLTETSDGFFGSHTFEELESNYLQPERLSIVGMNRERPDLIAPYDQESCPQRPLFSAAELRNNARMLLASYSAFGEDPAFSAMAKMVIALSRRCTDDYWIGLSRSQLASILANQSAIAPEQAMNLLVARPGSHAEQTNRHHAFVEVDGMLHGNVVLLGRFLNEFKNKHLASRRRFVIHSGFAFEERVKSKLASMGFAIQPIKRIGRREFDVIAVRNGVIFNLQCKNNALDLDQIEAQPQLVAAANRRLVAYYRRSLKKERARQGLLQVQLGLKQIRHLVISRFPVITTDPAIIPYNAIGKLAT